jgi:hypothetical protein
MRAWFSGLRDSPYNLRATPASTAVLISFMSTGTASGVEHARQRPPRATDEENHLFAGRRIRGRLRVTTRFDRRASG